MQKSYKQKLDDTIDKISEKYFQKLKSHLPLCKDPTVIILRGHLLVEELLDKLIAMGLKDTSAIKDARLTFYQKLCITQGLIGKSNTDMWKSIKELNRLRNKISHTLPDAELVEKLDFVLKAFFETEFDEIPKDIYSKSKSLRNGIVFLCAQLYGFIKGIEIVKEIVKKKHPTTA